MSLVLSLSGWRAFRAVYDQAVVRAYLRRVAASSAEAFKAQMLGPKYGRLYYRPGRVHRASAPGQFPANDYGLLRKSIRSETTKDSATVGSNMPYSLFLRDGTVNMAPRKMSKEALGIGIARQAKVGVGRFARFRHT